VILINSDGSLLRYTQLSTQLHSCLFSLSHYIYDPSGSGGIALFDIAMFVSVSLVIFLFSYFYDSVHFPPHSIHNYTVCLLKLIGHESAITLFHHSVTSRTVSIDLSLPF
jgi:hypothetical protein